MLDFNHAALHIASMWKHLLSAEACREKASGSSSLLFPLLVCVALMACSVFCQHGGLLSPEVEARLPYYLSPRSLLSKIYDSDYVDGGMYQAREMSYVLDYVDCKFIALCVALGLPHFLSLSHYAFLIVISLVLWRFAVDDLKMDRGIVFCVLLLLWTSPAVFLGGAFFRTAKIAVALAVVVLYWRIFSALKAAREDPNYRLPAHLWLSCFGWAWAATLFDRQGVFMVVAAIWFLGFWYLGYREKNTLRLMGVFVAALALSFLYNYIIAPLLTLSINGYWPDFHYQQLPWGKLIANPWFYVRGGVSFYVDTVRFFLGNIPAWAAVLAVAGLAYVALMKGSGRGKFVPVVFGLLLSQTILIWGMNTLMVLRHEGLLWEDVRRTYYVLPVLAMSAMTLALVLGRIQHQRLVAKGWLVLLLSAAVLGNIFALPGHYAILRGERAKDLCQTTPALLEALRHLRNPAYPVTPEVARNRVFQFFHDGRFPSVYVLRLPGSDAAVKTERE